jgi:hypothetical protein
MWDEEEDGMIDEKARGSRVKRFENVRKVGNSWEHAT